MAHYRHRRRSRRVRSLSVVLGILLSLGLAAVLWAGAWFWAEQRPHSAALTGERALAATVLDLYVPGERVSVPAPQPAAAPEVLSGTTDSDVVEIIGQEEGLTVSRIQGKRYRGFVAVIDDPMRLYVATCPYFSEGAGGRTVKQMADENGAVLAVNGGGFMDIGGVGTGGVPTGNVVAGGEMLWPGGGSTVAMDYEGKLHVGEFSGDYCKSMNFSWALSYGPTLIEDGAIRANLDDYLQEPRTAVGQRADGTVVLLNIQGRQASALGVTCQELAEILFRYGCINAGNLDGGASSDMYYQGEYINICNTSGGPRPLPTSLLVAPAGNNGVEEAQEG